VASCYQHFSSLAGAAPINSRGKRVTRPEELPGRNIKLKGDSTPTLAYALGVFQATRFGTLWDEMRGNWILNRIPLPKRAGPITQIFTALTHIVSYLAASNIFFVAYVRWSLESSCPPAPLTH